jgi:hypothetical protein
MKATYVDPEDLDIGDGSITDESHQHSDSHLDSDSDSEPKYEPFSSSEEWGKPAIHEFTNIYPEFPNTHVNGYAYIIELDEQLLNEKAIMELKSNLQYSQTNGKGKSLRANVKFFQQENGLPVPMTHWVRQCAGIKFLPLLILYLYLILNQNRYKSLRISRKRAP